MKTRKLVPWMAVIALLGLTALAGDQDFTLANQTGVNIQELYLSPTATDDWEEDVLGVDVLADGDSVEVKFSPDEEAEFWDLKVVDDEGASIIWKKLNLLEISKVTLHYENGEPTADAE